MKHIYYGINGASLAWLTANLSHSHSKILLICKNIKSLEDRLADLAFFNKEVETCSLPAWDTLPLELLSPSRDISASRLHALFKIQHSSGFICLTTVEALLQKSLPFKFYERLAFKLLSGEKVDFENLRTKFISCFYNQTAVVEEPGDLAVRGNVIDFFPYAAHQPIRVEMQDNTVVRLMSFDVDTQRTTQDIAECEIIPVREKLSMLYADDNELLQMCRSLIKERGKALEVPPSELSTVLEAVNSHTDLPGIELLHVIGTENTESLIGCFPRDLQIIIEDQSALEEKIDHFFKQVDEHAQRLKDEHRLFPAPEKLYLSGQEALLQLSELDNHYVNDIRIERQSENSADILTKHINASSNIELSTRLKTLIGTGKALKPMSDLLNSWRQQGFRVAFVVGTEARAERLQRSLLDLNFDASIRDVSGSAWMRDKERDAFVILLGNLSQGFTLGSEKIVFISENEIFPEKSYRKSKPAKITMRRILNSLSQLAVDDFIVHSDYGIGIYRGLKHLEIEGVQGDFLQIDYADSKLYLPVHNIGKVQKFYAGDNQIPVIDKLSSNRWSKTKLKVKQALVELAGDLIKLYAVRNISKGWRFEPFGADDERFSDGFPFSETPDQLRSIKEVLDDMASDKPMDRLVCGDVGFGKTEVALRAAFKCTQHTRQTAVLVPTTILVEQHYRTFRQRFADFPVRVAAVSRFYSKEENRKTLEDLAKGEVDIIIGTHRLLQKDVYFKDLGLLIVDEEHRFGVKQKEKLKQIKKDVDVLSMTATPIPRTLYMSLLDIRDASLITTAPHDRKVIRSYVASFSESLVRDAILREIQRGGQCFYIHNRVQSIAALAARLQELVPEVRFDYAHGQMSELQLENIMQKFLKGEINVLVSTTIIESGLDIPNANTIIIDRADTFGLAQLYQLRGRVGRSDKQAYAYFLIPKTTKLGGEAKQRLSVLQSLDDLGVGFNLAIRDLEIRGAGNLLGKEQSGNVLAVGFELYTKILKEAVLNVKGEELPAFETVDPEMKLNIPAFIPEYYIPDISERLVLYQRLAMIVRSCEADELKLEIEDRFGNLPGEVDALVEVMRLRGLLRMFAVVRAELSKAKLHISFTAHSPLDINKIINLVKNKEKSYSFSKSHIFSINLDNLSAGKRTVDAAFLYYAVKELLLEIGTSEIDF